MRMTNVVRMDSKDSKVKVCKQAVINGHTRLNFEYPPVQRYKGIPLPNTHIDKPEGDWLVFEGLTRGLCLNSRCRGTMTII